MNTSPLPYLKASKFLDNLEKIRKKIDITKVKDKDFKTRSFLPLKLIQLAFLTIAKMLKIGIKIVLLSKN